MISRKNIWLWKKSVVNLNVSAVKCEGEGKVISLQVLTGPEGFSRLRLPDFKTIGT
jgi:hypothetical protein